MRNPELSAKLEGLEKFHCSTLSFFPQANFWGFATTAHIDDIQIIIKEKKIINKFFYWFLF